MERIKKYNIILHSNVSAEIEESAVRKAMGYDKYRILTQEDWDKTCQQWIMNQLVPQSSLPITSLDFEEIQEEKTKDVDE